MHAHIESSVKVARSAKTSWIGFDGTCIVCLFFYDNIHIICLKTRGNILSIAVVSQTELYTCMQKKGQKLVLCPTQSRIGHVHEVLFFLLSPSRDSGFLACNSLLFSPGGPVCCCCALGLHAQNSIFGVVGVEQSTQIYIYMQVQYSRKTENRRISRTAHTSLLLDGVAVDSLSKPPSCLCHAHTVLLMLVPAT